MDKFEYRRIPVGNLGGETLLNTAQNWGKHGWRVVQVIQPFPTADSWFVLLERRKRWWRK